MSQKNGIEHFFKKIFICVSIISIFLSSFLFSPEVFSAPPFVNNLQNQINALQEQINNLGEEIDEIFEILEAISSSTPKIVFVTSQTYTGDLGGIDGADQKCQQLAEDAGLPGLYSAWLSDSTTSPAQRFIKNKAPYMLVDGTAIADDWNDLTDGSLDAPINRDENNNVVSRSVWTNTNANGTLNGDLSCQGWTFGMGGDFGGVGNSSETDDDWTLEAFSFCAATLSLYCFQQF
jgi:hypothetical protein